MIPLETISIATPCSADWNEMKGDDRVRFCGHCSLNVYNLSGMTRVEAETLVRENEGRLCVRMHRRADGTVITEDCPVGLRAVRKSAMRRVRSVMAAAASLVAGVTGLHASEPAFMGRMVARPDDATEQSVDTTATTEPIAEPDGSVVMMGGLMPAPEMGEVAAWPEDTVSTEPVDEDVPDADEPDADDMPEDIIMGIMIASDVEPVQDEPVRDEPVRDEPVQDEPVGDSAVEPAATIPAGSAVIR